MLQLLNNKIIKTKADLTIEMDRLMRLSGIGHPSISPKINVVSLSKIMEMMLQYMVINEFANEDLRQNEESPRQLIGAFDGDNHSIMVSDSRSGGSRQASQTETSIYEDPPSQANNLTQSLSLEGMVRKARKVLIRSWLLYQETSMRADPVEPNTIKQVHRLFSEKKLNDLQRRMTVLRSKWLYGDFESSLSFQAMKIYEESVKLNKRMVQ